MRRFTLRFILLLAAVHCMPGCLSSEKSTAQLHLRNINLDEPITPAIVLGGGIAGLTAALYLAQANIPCIVIEGAKPGGALAQSHSVRNWPGKLDVPGADIVGDIKQQAINNNVVVLEEEAVEVDFISWPYRVKTKQLSDGKIIERPVLSCIVAMGAEPNYLGIPGETGDDGYWGRGVSNCAVCEGSLYKGKKVVVVGGGDAAIVEAGYLANIAQEVQVLVRNDNFRAKDIKARDHALGKPNVKVHFNTQAKEVKGDGDKVTELVIENSQTHERKNIDIDGFFLAIGSQPKTSIFKKQLELDARGFIVLKNHQATSKAGIFAAGDVCDPVFVQAITSAGQGCMAALQAKSFLDDIGFEVIQSNKNEDQSEFEEAVDKKDELTRREEEGEHDNGSVMRPRDLRDFAKTATRSSLPTVIDFYSDLCIPCQRMEPIFKELAQVYKGRVNFIKINVSKSGSELEEMVKLVHAKRIQNVPTFSFIKNGKEVERLIGLRTRDEFSLAIQKLLARK